MTTSDNSPSPVSRDVLLESQLERLESVKKSGNIEEKVEALLDVAILYLRDEIFINDAAPI